jgi:hypothetical protein
MRSGFSTSAIQQSVVQVENREIGIVAKRDSHHSGPKGIGNGDCPCQRGY